ncbi:MAG: phosphatase PAP2 family protein [Candidatus Acidiferrales bacterium]
MSAGNRTARTVVIALLVGCAVAFATRREFYTEALVDPFFALALASVLILHFRVRPRLLDGILVGTSTLILAFIDFRVLHYAPALMAWLSFFGVSSLLVLGVACALADSKHRKLLLYAWIPAFLFLTSDWFATNMLAWVSEIHPKTLDLYLLSFDASLHVQLSFVMGRVFASVPWLREAGLFFYSGLAIPITLVYAGRLARLGTKASSTMLAFLITGPAGILLYGVFPACGPAHMAHGYFPFHPLSIADTSRLLLEPIAIVGARNAIPSLHMAWTLLAWWYSRGLSWLERAIAFTFLAFTVLATLGTGEHYFVDLIVAFPFALLVQAVCAYEVPWTDSPRLQAIGFGLGGVFLWFAALRFANRVFWASPIIPWAVVAATIVLVELRRTELRRAVDAHGETSAESAVLMAEAN